MESIKLGNNATYTLVTNGIREGGDSASYYFLPDTEKTFEQVEADFSNISNTEKVYVIGAEGDVIKSVVGYTSYKGMEKVNDYVISSTTTNNGTEEEPDWHTTEERGTVYIVHMGKPSLVDKVKGLEETVDMLVLSALEG